jgi:HK97 family phage portal protein
MPNSEQTSMTWRQTMQAHVLMYGNGYSEIVRDGSGRAFQLWPITPDRVTPYRRGSESSLEYRVINRDSSEDFIPSSDMLHIHGIGWDGIQGYGVIAKARESIGLGMAAEQFGAAMYGNGLAIGGVIAFPGPKPPELSEKNYIATLNSQHKGVDRAHKLLALYNGAKYERMNISPNDAQFLETRKFQVAEIARWFNIPPHKLGDLSGSTHSNIEQQSIDYYTNSLLPWLKVWEQELYLKLVPASERNIQFFEHDAKGFLRADSQMRWEAFSRQFMAGAITPNEMRDTENLNPIKGGDISAIPLINIPIHLSEAYYLAEIDLKKANAEHLRQPPPAPVAPTAAPDPNKAREIELLTEARDTARRCAQEAEDAKDVKAAELATALAALAHVQTDRDAIAAARATETADHQRQIESLSLDVTVAQRDAEAHAATAQREIEQLTAQLAESFDKLMTTARDLTAAMERGVMIEADYQRVCGEKTDIDDARIVAVTRAEQAEAAMQTRSEACDRDMLAVQEERNVAVARAVAAEERIVTLETDGQRMTVDLAHADEVNQATVAELRGQIASLSQELTTTTASLLEARTAIGALEGTRDSQRDLLTASDDAIAGQTAVRQQLEARLSATQQAIRGTLVDAANRLIAKETERARKAQGSPDKLGAWVHTFYPIHEDFCRVALKPAVRAMLIALGSDASVDRVLDGIVLAHVSESSRQLQGVIQDADLESLAPALERVLRRWEAERAEALADRIMKEAA